MAESIWVVLIDTSGSMKGGFTRRGKPTGIFETGHWDSKLDAAKDLLIRRIGMLRSPDVAVIEFKSKARRLFFEPASKFSKYIDTIRDLRAGGRTRLDKALIEAANIPKLATYKQIKVLVISDGLTDAAAAEYAADRLRKNVPQATISVLLMDKTDEGDETAYRVATNEDVTYAASISEVSSSVGRSMADLLALEASSVARRQAVLLSELLSVQDRPRLETLFFEGSDATALTALTLSSDVIPVLEALETLQSIADSSADQSSQVRILTISKTSPINASISGVAKAVEVVDELLTPWKRKHAKTMADLRERMLRQEILQIHAQNLAKHSNAELMRAQARKMNAEAERLEIENENKRIRSEEEQLRRQLLFLAKEAVGRLSAKSDLDHATRLHYETQALKAINAYVNARFDVRVLREEQ